MSDMVNHPKYGDTRSDGFICVGRRYDRSGGVLWRSPESFHRYKVTTIHTNRRKAALSAGVRYDVTIDYLLSIFPTDWRCPVLDIQMSWGGVDGINSSPSLDRIIPTSGYVKGNVAWISMRANTIKSDATPDEVARVARWMEARYV